MSKSWRAGRVGSDKGLLKWWTIGLRVQPSQMKAPGIGCSAAGRSQMKRSLAGLSASAAGPIKDAPQRHVFSPRSPLYRFAVERD